MKSVQESKAQFAVLKLTLEISVTTIFEHFRQLDGSSTRWVEGSGLGLAITLHLVQLHRGTINLKSQLREGIAVLNQL